ncbi:MAG TPA: GNAT family N-acetyltransferase [Gemmatimonadota bacterium]|nr:GNAT family N-acetyltransferase [Gemmatimonadota bacterium]
MDIETRHEPEQSRFAADIEGQIAHLDYAEPSEGVLDYRHTWVPESLRNQGIGEQLVLDALDWARGHRYRVIPTCPFVAAVVRRHAEYADLLEKRG